MAGGSFIDHFINNKEKCLDCINQINRKYGEIEARVKNWFEARQRDGKGALNKLIGLPLCIIILRIAKFLHKLPAYIGALFWAKSIALAALLVLVMFVLNICILSYELMEKLDKNKDETITISIDEQSLNKLNTQFNGKSNDNAASESNGHDGQADINKTLKEISDKLGEYPGLQEHLERYLSRKIDEHLAEHTEKSKSFWENHQHSGH